MTETINENLLPFKDALLPYIRSLIVQAERTTSITMNAYADLLNAGNAEQEDRDLLADVRHHQDLVLHSLNHLLDALEQIGTPRRAETYYNFVDGEPVEVDKEHFAGLPEELE